MEKRKLNLRMKLDGFKKISAPGPVKARTMGVLSKIGIMYKSGKLIMGLFIVIYFVYLVFDDFFRKGVALKSWFSTALDTGMLIGAGLCILIGIFLFQWGMRRMFKTISIIEYGARASATVKSISKTRVSTWYSRRFFPVTRWIATCWFNDSSGKTVKFDVIAPAEDYLKKGDQVDVVYDTGMPANALAIDAIPFFVKTDPGLSA